MRELNASGRNERAAAPELQGAGDAANLGAITEFGALRNVRQPNWMKRSTISPVNRCRSPEHRHAGILGWRLANLAHAGGMLSGAFQRSRVAALAQHV